MIKRISIILTSFFILLNSFYGKANNRDKHSVLNGMELTSFKYKPFENTIHFHNDSIHRLNFKYADKQRGIKPYIVPAVLVSGGTALHFMTNAKEHFRDFAQDNFPYHGSFDDYAQYAPLVTVYALNALGIKGKNNFGNRTALAFKSILLNKIIVSNLKIWTNVQRPSGDAHSFPSGHTSMAFVAAQFLHKEYGDISPWFSIGGYSCAATVGIMRVAKNAHWISDVIAGAGIGMLSTELIYLTHQYKWDNEHLKKWDIFPFQMGSQKGITMVYRF